MKKYIHSSDWEYNSTPEVNALKELMASNIEGQDDPKVGIFWYDTENNELFGVKDVATDEASCYDSTIFNREVRTCKALHYKVWQKEYYRGKDKRFRGDYTFVPRGRVFYVEGQGYVVIVGDWIDDHPEAKQEILFEFDLPEDTRFQKIHIRTLDTEPVINSSKKEVIK